MNEQPAKEHKYKVMVDDNFHYMSERERFQAGEYGRCEEATAECKRIVDSFLERAHKEGMTAEELMKSYMSFGEDPFIISDDADCVFSAWNYAKQRCAELCQRGQDG
jgi:hypothetical protein